MRDHAPPSTFRLSEAEFPLAADACLCVITGVEGASYRPVGAAMSVWPDGRRAGSLSSGCIDEDVALHAAEALATRRPSRLRYGRGSPFLDLQLPCGGGLDVTLIPAPDPAVVARVRARLDGRREVDLAVDLALDDGPLAAGLRLTLLPRLRVLAFGNGPEVRAFAALARAAGTDLTLHSDEPAAGALPIDTHWSADARTAIALFFHDHAREIPILERALASPALYVGAQGSARVREERAEALRVLGCDPLCLASPFGLIERARDPHTLAAGVLSQILDTARQS